MIKTFSTPRLSLQLITVDDWEFALQIVNTDGWLEFIGDRNVHSQEEAIEYIERLLNTKDLYYWTIRMRDDEKPIGIVSFIKRNHLEHFDIGFALLPAYEGKGYAYEAAHAILAFAKNDLKHKTLLATALPSNANSIRLLKKLEFSFLRAIVHEGVVVNIFINGNAD